MIIKEWKFPLLREFVINNAVMTSAQAKKFLDEQDIVMSRASVIGALNRWCKDGILGYVEEQGQGGTRKVYRRLVNGEQFLSLLRCELNAIYNETSRGLKGDELNG